MKRRTKTAMHEGSFRVWKAVREGREPVVANKDDSVSTKPIVNVPLLLEADVLSNCLSWLRGRRVMADRLNNGAGILADTGMYATYGIVGGGDIIAILPGGIHCEIECKAGRGGRLSVEQQKRRERVLAAGGKYFVVHGIAELEIFISPYLEKFDVSIS